MTCIILIVKRVFAYRYESNSLIHLNVAKYSVYLMESKFDKANSKT